MSGIFVSSLLLAFLFNFKQSISIDPKAACSSALYPTTTPNPTRRFEIPQKVFQTEEDWIDTGLAAPPLFGEPISQEERGRWIVKCSSEQVGHECSNAVDGLEETFWYARLDTTGPQLHPGHLTLDINLGATKNVNAISIKSTLNDAAHGIVAGHKVYLSLDGKRWGDAVAYGAWSGHETGQMFAAVQNDNKLNTLLDQYSIFEPQPARYVRFQATSAADGKPFISIRDLSVWSDDSFTPSAAGLGKWGPTITFPLIPVAAFLDPISGKLIAFSAFQRYSFNQAETNHSTWTATWDRATGVSDSLVKTGHDMFCPGTAYDANGRMIVTGGVSDERTTIYDPNTGQWKSSAAMNIRRGYQGSATVGDGRTFVIGGSWAPEKDKKNFVRFGDRNGEMYDGKADRWTKIDNCLAKPLETTEDWEQGYRSDNHMWLFGWKGNSIFHAGPAKQMNWITVTGSNGAIVEAGTRGERGKANDSDAMCGVAAMYDAVKGEILTAGGAPQYKYCDDNTPNGTGKTYHPSTNHAYIITLGNINQTVTVQEAGQGMKFQRVFHHAVILPNGDTFVVGGQKLGQGFTDQSAVFKPEIWSPTNKAWTLGTPNTIPRTYHSFALLLQDATVLVGGGGLCGDEDCKDRKINHADAEIYTPQYLLTSSPRPSIKKLSPKTALPGDTLTFTTTATVVSASLIRYGSSTHSVNNDQRRIPLVLRATGKQFEYNVSVPSERGVAIPGYWMLFVINNAGVPSTAANVQIQVTP